MRGVRDSYSYSVGRDMCQRFGRPGIPETQVVQRAATLGMAAEAAEARCGASGLVEEPW